MFFAAALAVLAQKPADLAAPVEVPFRIADRGSAIIVDVAVNGKACSLMFDSGFSGEVMLSSAIDIGKPTGTMRLRDFVGELDAPVVKINSLSIGALKVQSTDLSCIQQPESFTESYGTHCDGILGFGVIRDYVVEINVEKQKFVFYPRSYDITKKTPDNVKTFLHRLEDQGLSSLELKCEVNGQPLTMALDTGNAFYITTHKESLIRVGAWDAKKKPSFMKSSWVASGPVDSFDMLLRNTKVFGVPVKESVWSVIDLPSSSVDSDGTVGFQFLKNFNITFDFLRRYVWLENYNGKTSEDQMGEPGFLIYPDKQGRYVILKVYPDGPAAQAGIQEGDILVMAGGKSLSMVSRDQLKALLDGPEGTICKVAVSRNGVLNRYDLKRMLMVNGRSSP